MVFFFALEGARICPCYIFGRLRYGLTFSKLLSGEPSFTMMISKFLYVCVRTDSIAWAMYFSPLYTGIITLTFGLVILVIICPGVCRNLLSLLFGWSVL